MVVQFALLHPVAHVSWTSFTVHWSTVIGLALLAGLYEWRARVAAKSGATPPTRGQRSLFYMGLAAIFFALNGPLHDLSDSLLFSAHMVQHLVLTLVVPPMLIAGTPGALLRPALSVRAVGSAARAVTSAVACYAIFNVALTVWHLPVLYNLALEYHPVHIAQHLVLMAAAVLMWWPLMSPLPELPRIAYPMQMLYCFLMTIPMSLIAIFITYSDSVLFPAYAWAPRIWGISPMQDQLLGGLIMWIPGGLFFVGVMAVIFFKWAARDSDSAAGSQASWPAAG